MKKIYFFLLFLIASTSLFAQQITFQGKLYQGNLPVNGTGNFQFLINASGVNWSENHPNVPINNGLYAVVLGSQNGLPLDLFKTNQSIPMQVLYNNNLIDNVTLYAPFERDYTVPDSIKDGVSWNELQSKPSVDTSITNELQTLSINGNTLSISRGNSVVLPASGGITNNTIIGQFSVIDTSASLMPGVGQNSNISTNSFTTTIWQSFLCTSSGRLRILKLYLGSVSATSVVINFFNGVGPSQSVAGPISIPINGGASIRTLDVTALNLALIAGRIYSFSISPSPNGTQAIIGRNNTSTDLYPNGVSNYGTSQDLFFEIFSDKSNPPSFTVLNNGYVGISNSSPTSQLSVAGRIEDATGFVTPVGTIIAYAGRTVPKGWLLCDGASLSRSQYPELFNAIDTSWGAGSQPGMSFRLPDLRGLFLRGVDGAAGRDADVSSRTSISSGGNSGNAVGSLQDWAIIEHQHTGSYVTGSHGNPGSGVYRDGVYGLRSGPGAVVGVSSANISFNETRPKNAYVNYIIKY